MVLFRIDGFDESEVLQLKVQRSCKLQKEFDAIAQNDFIFECFDVDKMKRLRCEPKD